MPVRLCRDAGGGIHGDGPEESLWDEPTGPEEPAADVVVEPIAKHLPMLMQRKYGDDWELLINADANDGVTDVDSASYVDEVAIWRGGDDSL